MSHKATSDEKSHQNAPLCHWKAHVRNDIPWVMSQPQKLRKRSPHVDLTDAELDQWKASLRKTSQSDALRSLILWFVSQPDILQGLILDTVPPSLRQDAARIALERLVAKPKTRR